MILYLLLTVHVILSIALILIVLLQTGKGSDLASAFGGGGANAVFGGAGPTSFLNRVTTAVAVLFMVTSIALAYVGAGSSSIMPDQEPAEEAVPAEGEALPGTTESAPAEEAAAGESQPATTSGTGSTTETSAAEPAAQPPAGQAEQPAAQPPAGEPAAVAPAENPPAAENAPVEPATAAEAGTQTE